MRRGGTDIQPVLVRKAIRPPKYRPPAFARREGCAGRVVVRTLASLRKCRGILVRYCKHAAHYLALVQVACALLWYRRLRRLTHSDDDVTSAFQFAKASLAIPMRRSRLGKGARLPLRRWCRSRVQLKTRLQPERFPTACVFAGNRPLPAKHEILCDMPGGVRGRIDLVGRLVGQTGPGQPFCF